MPRPTRGKSNATIVQAAREQRHTLTPTEKKLWEAVRDRRLAGLKFRRQHPRDRFILDFFCIQHQLVVEVDGGIHAGPDQAAHDAERTDWLKARGIRVLRFSNDEVQNHFDAALKRIVEVAASPPAPSPEVEKRTSEEGENYSSSPDDIRSLSGEGAGG
jgi:very-short-patch-repair endonuclease